MAQSYKVFVEEKLLLITEQENYQAHWNSFDVLLKAPNPEDMWETYLSLKSGKIQSACFIFQDVQAGIVAFKSLFTLAEAAGGLVKDRLGRYLFIYRNDRWDLPKGKLEVGESIESGAIREVWEECGLERLTIIKPLGISYHTYERKGRDFFKPTYWFLMNIPDTQEGQAQLEEGITHLKWAKSEELVKIAELSYATIREVIDSEINHPRP